MIQFRTLVSGSSGNAVLLSYNRVNLLIDCGVSGKQITSSLSAMDIAPADISYILVTHEHIDHTKGVGILSRRYNIPVVASDGTWRNMEIGKIAPDNRISFSDYSQMDIGGIGVTPFEIPHDAAMPTGYRFDIGSQSFAVATDMGHITDSTKKVLAGCDYVVLEANYDEMMLEHGRYPYPLKRRIGSRKGHLCNDDAGVFSKFLVENNTKHIILGHLSNENNSPEKAFETVARELEFADMKVGSDILLSIAPRYSVSSNIGA